MGRPVGINQALENFDLSYLNRKKTEGSCSLSKQAFLLVIPKRYQMIIKPS